MNDKLTAISRKINLALFGEDVMFCYTIYQRRYRLRYFIFKVLVDWLFWLVRKERNHCRRCFNFENRRLKMDKLPCDCCKTIISPTSALFVDNGKYYCSIECYTNSHIRCKECGKSVSPDGGYMLPITHFNFCDQLCCKAWCQKNSPF